MSEAEHTTCFVLLIQMWTVMTAGQQTMDEMISNAAETPAMFAMPQPSGQHSPPEVRVELDMVFTRRQWQHIQMLQAQSGSPYHWRYPRKAIKGHNYRWPEGVVPYDFDSNSHFSEKDRAEIHKAIEEWQMFTCLQFVRASYHHINRVRFTNGGGCFSNVGMVGDAQVVGLAPGCRWKSVVAHELGHAVGFQHEQTRPDRDHHVTILSQNIPPHLRYNFRKYTSQDVDLYRLQYDYHSIMHYGAKAFSFNGQPTIRTKADRYQDVIGKARGLSFLDIKLANLMYTCAAHCSQDKTCPEEGFMDKHCRCMCPGEPLQECSGRRTTSASGSETTTRTRTGSSSSTVTSSNECQDQYALCPQWAVKKHCDDPVNGVYMQAYCRRSCQLCYHEPEEDCRDKDENCEFWKSEGHCTHAFVDFMQTNCPRSCGHCTTVTYSSKAKGEEKKHHYSVTSSNVHDDAKARAVTTQAMTFHVFIVVLNVLVLQ